MPWLNQTHTENIVGRLRYSSPRRKFSNIIALYM